MLCPLAPLLLTATRCAIKNRSSMNLQTILAVLPDISLIHTTIALKSHRVWLGAFPQTIRLLAYERLSLGVPGCPFPIRGKLPCPTVLTTEFFWAFSYWKTSRESTVLWGFFLLRHPGTVLKSSWEMDGGMEWDIFPKSNPPEPNLAIPPGLELKLTCLDFIFPEFSMKMRTKSARMLAEALFFPKLQKKKKNAGQSNSLRSAKNNVSASSLRLHLRQTEFGGQEIACVWCCSGRPIGTIYRKHTAWPFSTCVCLALGIVLGQINTRQESLGRTWMQS